MIPPAAPAIAATATGYRRHLPRIEESFADCGYLFQQFREHLIRSQLTAVVGIRLETPPGTPPIAPRTLSLFVRLVGKRLRGRIEGGYRASDREFFLLLVPAGPYDATAYEHDLAAIRRELERHFLCHGRRTDAAVATKVDGVLLSNTAAGQIDNAIFGAFRELFGASLGEAEGVTAGERREIEEIVREGRITPFFQPIFALADGTVYGYEALSRIAGPTLIGSPDELFDKAIASGHAPALEMLCRTRALHGASRLAVPGRLFLNVCPALLTSSDHRQGKTSRLLDELGIDRSRVTFELTERTMIDDYELFNRVLAYYRSQGYSIAIDDLGAGYAGLKMLAQLEPDYVKLARFLVDDIHLSAKRQALVESLVGFCRRLGITVIAEGIERPEELAWLAELGVPLAQGYLLGRPAAAPLAPAYVAPEIAASRVTAP